MTRCRRICFGLRCVFALGHRGPHQIALKSGTTVRWFTKAETKRGKRIRL